MWAGVVEYLKNPLLVARVQEFFGVRIHHHGSVRDVKHEKKKDRCKNECKCVRPCEHSNNAAGGSLNASLNGCCVRRGIGNGYEKIDTPVFEESSNQYDGALCNLPVHTEEPQFTILNRFWYYLFLFGTELGDEVFYCTFIPFWFWNIDGVVGRRVVLVWAVVMTIGQALKDIICWPRPACPPAARLQSKWSQEYGMPSTHAMVGVSIPFSVVLYTMNRYIYPTPVGFAIAILWCSLVCISRIYLGMHTMLDILAGLLLAIALMIPLVPLVDITDYYIVSNFGALVLLITISILTIVYYPCSDKWTPTRGDTTMVVSVTVGVHVGAWINYNTGAMTIPSVPPPYHIMWPSYVMLGRLVLRTLLGFCCVVATKAISKFLCYTVMCAILRINSKELMKSENYLENRNKILVELIYKYIACFMIGMNTVYLLPNVFTIIGIERPTFYTEL